MDTENKNSGGIRPWLPLLSLACAVFAFNSSELMPIGLLIDIAKDFEIPVAKAGLLITFYAWVVALMSLPLMVLCSRMAYRKLLLGVLLLFAAFEVGSSAVEKLVAGTYTAQVTPVSFIVMVGTLVVNLFVTLYERRAGKRLKSEILAADAAHTLSDAFVSIGVIVGLGFVVAGFPMADPIMALLVTVAILASAVGVFRTGLRTLSDHARIPAADIARAAEKVDGVRSIHAVRTRGTEAEVYCDLHVLVDPQMTVLAAHDLGDKVEGVVAAAFPQIKEVLVHIEPDTAAERAEG